jgi:midasin
VRLLRRCTYDQQATHFTKMMQVTDNMFKTAYGGSTSKLLLVLSDGRGIYNEGRDKVIEHVRRLKLANVFVVFVIIENETTESVLDMKMAVFDDETGPTVVPYLEQFPFSFYLILKDISKLPQSLSDAIRQWFELVSKSNQ